MNTLADLERITGAKRRSLQLWADAGAIRPEGQSHAGTGRHRLFSDDETRVAAILAIIASRQIAIGQLVKYAVETRKIISGLKAGDILVIGHREDDGTTTASTVDSAPPFDCATFVRVPA